MRHLLVVALLIASPLAAQTAQPTAPKTPVASIASRPDWPKAKPADVDSAEHIVAAAYDVISGPPNQPRDWVRFRSLFIPDGRLMPVRHNGTASDVLPLSVDDYAARSSARMQADGFSEKSTHNVVEQYGDIVHVFSTYESRHAAAEPKPFARGINSFQLLKDGGRYWIVSIYWDAERPETPIPAKYSATDGGSASQLNQYLRGEWVGQLEYRDFQANERVFLPTWLTMEALPDGHSINLTYVYDDGPTKTVREESTLALLTDAKAATMTSNRDHTSERYNVTGFEEFAKLNRGTLLLTGPGTENNKPVDVRITLTLRRNLFTLVKETKAAGEDYKFRDGYTFTRRDEPKTN